LATVDKKDVEDTIKKLRFRKARWVSFKIRNEADRPLEIVSDKTSPRNHTFKDFVKDVSDMKCSYYLYDKEFKTPDGRITSSLHFIYWVPPNCNQNDRILYSSGKPNLMQVLEGFKIHNFSEKDEIEELLQDEAIPK